jgi:hypothetical protein
LQDCKQQRGGIPGKSPPDRFTWIKQQCEWVQTPNVSLEFAQDEERGSPGNPDTKDLLVALESVLLF